MTEEEIKKLVLIRLESMPSNIRISLGGRDFSKEELINEVKGGTTFGKKIIEVQLEYLRAMKSGFQ